LSNDQSAKRPLRIGLTGGIASGKTTVASYFSDLGVPIIDTDVLAREVVAPGAPALDEIRGTFGDEVFQLGGTLDRRAMRKIVFSDDVKRRQLESILHPQIREAVYRRVAEIGDPYMIIVVPLLFGSPMVDFMDRVLVVDCDEAVQLSRLLQRDTENAEQARRMIAAQASRDDRLSIADDVVTNDADLQETQLRVAALHNAYLRLSASD
jgi:dephospho-CoA kinase